jgi:hypothetical protein
MGRVYSKEGKLVRLDCDSCAETITPHPDIAESGWMKSGQLGGWFGDTGMQWIHCPKCWANRRR